MNPHRLTWGFAYGLRFALLIGTVTLVAWLISREPKKIPWHPVTILLVILTVWVSLTTQFAQFPEPAYAKWDRTTKILLFNGFVTLGLMRSRQRLDALIWVIVVSIGFYGIKGGLFTILGGGQSHVYGPAGSFIADNNSFGLAMIIVLPLMRYLQLSSDLKWVKLGLAVAMSLSAIAILGTQSRGTMVGFVVLALALILKSRKRLLIGISLALTLAMGVAFMPERWHARMATILTYEEDASMQGRLRAWQYGFETAVANPILGGGFAAFRGNKDPTTSGGYRAAHSIYFEVLGEHGFVGLALFLALGIGTFLTGQSIIRRARGSPDLAWARDLAAMIQVSLIAYAVSGLALSLAFFDLYYHLVAIMVITKVLVKEALVSSNDQKAEFHSAPDSKAAPPSASYKF
jgi:probable O-glycosylation ligase (exosortase A-associated)